MELEENGEPVWLALDPPAAPSGWDAPAGDASPHWVDAFEV